MLSKIALLFLAGMGLMAIVFGRPKPGDRGWMRRLRLLRRRGPEEPPDERRRRR
jgi:hypothetical protein